MTAALKLLGWRGIAGIAVALALGLMLAIQKGETRHWKKQSGQYETLYHGEQVAHAQTVANYRAAADQARSADRANAERVKAEQAAINERTTNDLETRLADARARAGQLQRRAETTADRGPRGAARVPGLSASPGGPDQAAGQDRLPGPDALTATEQAIQLDELIKWVERQHSIDPNVGAPPR
jgi:hypothetical protein